MRPRGWVVRACVRDAPGGKEERKLKKRLLNIAVALGLVSGLFIGAIAPAGAQSGFGPENPGWENIYTPLGAAR